MIKGLFETHIPVVSLADSMYFYETILGLELAHVETARRVAFFWIGGRGKAMLGLWEIGDRQITPLHFAFESTAADILKGSSLFFQERDLTHYNFLRDGSGDPMVFAWMPAVSVYFRDPDGHELELIAMLPGNPRPELGIISYTDWLKLSP